LIILLVPIIKAMEVLHTILLKKTHQNFNHSKEEASPKPRRKRKSESL
jgi:hypothetical protein